MHNIHRLPGAKVFAGLLWTVLVMGLLAWLAMHVLGLTGLGPQTAVDKHVSLSVLRSQALSFLVTRRTTTQIVVEHTESNWLGRWRGVLWVVVTIHHGIDLEKIRGRDIRREDGVTFVKLPGPEVLDFSIEPGTIGFMSKSTAVPKIADLLHNGHRRVLEARVRQAAREFVRQRDVLPTRDELVEQLNEAVAILASDGSVRLRFE